MIIFKTFCCCVPLRQGCLIVGYFFIIAGFLDVFFMMLSDDNHCRRLKNLWLLRNQINIIAGVLLLATSHNPENLTFLLPIQIVVKLVGLILEMIFYLLMASSGLLHPSWIVLSFLSLFATIYCLLIVYSFFQKLDQQF